jgi:hypothetical protein
MCACWQHEVPEHTPWVAFYSAVHTPRRCGVFDRLEVSRKYGQQPTLHVTWSAGGRFDTPQVLLACLGPTNMDADGRPVEEA